MSTITRYRGDTVPVIFAMTDEAGAALNITGYAYRLSVSATREPIGAPAFTITGAISNAPGGIVEFEPTPQQADQTPGVYYYDVEQTDTASNVLTVLKGTWSVRQDVSK